MTDTNRPEAVHDVLRDMRQWKGDYSVFADRIERTLSARASAGEGGVTDEMVERGTRIAYGDQPRDACGMRMRKDIRKILEGALHPQESIFTAAPQPAQAGASGGGEVADVIWRIDNEAAQFVDKSGMEYLRYLRGLLTPASPATGDTRHVGDSKFESWYADYCRTDWPDGTKQIARDAYAAGMGDATPQPAAAQGAELPEPFGHVFRVVSSDASLARRWDDRDTVFKTGPAISEGKRGALQYLNLYTADQLQTIAAAPQPQESEFFPIPAGLHPHTVNLVARFAAALADKLAKAERKYGYSDGWADADWMDECRAKLMEHVAKGDPRDVAAYCAFLWHHNERTAITPPAHGDGEGVDVALDAYRKAWERTAGRLFGGLDGLAYLAHQRGIQAALTTRPAPEAQEARDAARYRWLRDRTSGGSFLLDADPMRWLNCDEPPSEWDAAIDAAAGVNRG